MSIKFNEIITKSHEVIYEITLFQERKSINPSSDDPRASFFSDAKVQVEAKQGAGPWLRGLFHQRSKKNVTFKDLGYADHMFASKSLKIQNWDSKKQKIDHPHAYEESACLQKFADLCS